MADQIEHRIVVMADGADVFNLWANFENFPLFMPRLKSVRKTGETTSHWVMDGPLGATLEWDAETTAMTPNERIAWNSLAGSSVTTSGQVTFRAVGPNDTEITVRMGYEVPGGPVVEAAAAALGNAENMVEESLRRFKEHMENTGRRMHQGDVKAPPAAGGHPDGPTGDLGPIGS